MIDRPGIGFVTGLQVTVLIPAVTDGPRASDLDEPDASFHQPARQTTFAGINPGRLERAVESVERFCLNTLPIERRQFRNCGLHAVGQFMISNRALNRLGPGVMGEGRIQVSNQLTLASLNGLRIPRYSIGDGLTPRTQDRPLMPCRQESGRKTVQPARGHQPAFHDDKAGQVIILTTQAIGHPGSHGRPPRNPRARVQEIIGVGVFTELAGHRADHAQFISHPPEIRKQL